ncbi:MAG: tetratricopeptide repeat protein [Lapillicoccus sp.]
MSTVSPPRPPGTATGQDPVGAASRRPRWLRPAAPETDEQRADRLRLRRRLALWSLPVVVLLLLVAAKLLATVAFGEDAVRSYAAGNITGTQDAADHLAFGNVIEPHKAPFALGDARVLAGDFAGARAAFEEALTLAPKDSLESCQIRVNLVLSLEKLATAATSAGHGAEAQAFRDRLTQVVAEAPQGCFQGDAQGDEGQQLRDAQQRSQEQQQQEQQRQQDQQNQQNQQQEQPTQPNEDKQQQLDSRTQDNLQQRQQTDQQRGSPSGPSVAKPW